MPQRERITVTIRQELLRALDRMIDYHSVRNRSHALEVVLDRALMFDTHQALILASGQGVQMRPFTYEIPKPLIPVNGLPLLEHGIKLLKKHGVTDIVITVSHLAEKIIDHFGSGEKLGVKITYAQEAEPTGTGGAVRAAQKYLSDAPFILLYGDVLLKLDLHDFLETHKNTTAAIGTLALTSVADPSAYGAVRLRGTKIVDFTEKPSVGNTASRLIFSGCAIFNPSIFSYLPKKRGELSLERDVFPELMKHERLFGYLFEGPWFDVSTPESYERALKNW